MSSWGSWGSCTAPCGGGSQKRVRTVDTPPADGGRPCAGSLEEVGVLDGGRQSCAGMFGGGRSADGGRGCLEEVGVLDGGRPLLGYRCRPCLVP